MRGLSGTYSCASNPPRYSCELRVIVAASRLCYAVSPLTESQLGADYIISSPGCQINETRVSCEPHSAAPTSAAPFPVVCCRVQGSTIVHHATSASTMGMPCQAAPAHETALLPRCFLLQGHRVQRGALRVQTGFLSGRSARRFRHTLIGRPGRVVVSRDVAAMARSLLGVHPHTRHHMIFSLP